MTATKQKELMIKYVENIPQDLEDGILYISEEYSTAIHRCACGCGNQVVTPISSSEWSIAGKEIVTLRPSIGNWNFPCKSHYYITDNKIEWL